MSTTIIGIDKLYYAKIVSDGEGGTRYEKPKHLGYVQELSVEPKVETASQYGDNRAIETASAMGAIDVKLKLTGIDPEVEADVLGYEYANGATKKTAEAIAPEIALMYRRLKANGKYRYKVLYKGRLAIPSETTTTKEDKIDFQSTEFEASFMPRLSDGVFEYQIDEEMSGADKVVIQKWFEAVPEPVIKETLIPVNK
ncbi:major tail protein [Bacillus thuringiensis]